MNTWLGVPRENSQALAAFGCEFLERKEEDAPPFQSTYYLNNSRQQHQQEKQQQYGHLMDYKRGGASTTILF
uniref:Uncharacterized protein n=1 Tax=Meloidogyne incognita TaxID=6306 RepID=A0A914KQ65_MELIC